MDSVLDSIKELLGDSPDDNSFDASLIMHINSALAKAKLVGVNDGEGPTLRITDATTTWSDLFLGDDETYEAVKELIFLRVKMIFDPTTSAVVKDSFKERIQEIECMIADQTE